MELQQVHEKSEIFVGIWETFPYPFSGQKGVQRAVPAAHTIRIKVGLQMLMNRPPDATSGQSSGEITCTHTSDIQLFGRGSYQEQVIYCVLSLWPRQVH